MSTTKSGVYLSGKEVEALEDALDKGTLAIRTLVELLASIALLPVSMLLRAFVMHYLWDTFVYSAFGIPSPSLVHLMGAMLIVALIRGYKFSDNQPPSDKSIKSRIGLLVAGTLAPPLILILLGWLVSLFL